ncbi:M56 family metallopeptidase [Sphingobacterium chuzhouense]|uniref:TonB family protein n=1 Tax=Sphingobacterium chuzhouense TaxID=1742264 RepID=A0ABR7XWQ4_9SPHI|nr:M56 family metallopeptidase [Sphingobacterium chuzhouense]MBD1423500.1 TonB family protein [Sphingobacterium chuzhouense]
MTYLILANLSLILFFVIYILVLKRLTFFQWNRIYLLSAIAVSFVIPLLQFVDLSNHREVYRPLAIIDFPEMETVGVTDTLEHNHSWSTMDWARFLYIAGTGLMFFWLGIRLYRVFKTFGDNSIEQRSFSFFNRVFIAEETQHRDVIASHEQIHMKQGHSYDILFVEIVRVFNWFNPIFYFYLKELKFQHECIADKACSEDKVQYAELLVLNAMGVSHSVLTHEFSNQSFLKQRIMMLFKNKSKKINRAKYLLILPTVLMVSGVALAFNTSIKNIVPIGAEDLENIIQQDTTKSKAEREGKLKWKITHQGKSRKGENGTTVTEVIVAPQEQGNTDDKVFTAVEINPEPEGGLHEFRVWIGENYQFPQEAIDAGVKGQVVVSFIIEKDGTLGDFKIIKDLGHGTGEAAIETLKKAKPWRPGIQNGRKVRVAYTLPITINLEK